ncbi:hypothetical protein ACOZ35_09445 [Halorubrum xinjiangense]|uniref:hypothetical protein n=1 Tax=Halorubrum xinjiangense TaxID=261291 RepID=UPI003C6EC09F
MTHDIDALGWTIRRIATLAVPLLIAATGTAAAHGSGGYGGGMMGGWGLFGGAMGLWGLLWMGLLIAVPLYLVYVLLDRSSG